MKIDDAKKRIEQINTKTESGDFEAAHSLEDALLRDLVQDIAKRHDCGGHVREVAQAIVEHLEKTAKDPRWCA